MCDIQCFWASLIQNQHTRAQQEPCFVVNAHLKCVTINKCGAIDLNATDLALRFILSKSKPIAFFTLKVHEPQESSLQKRQRNDMQRRLINYAVLLQWLSYNTIARMALKCVTHLGIINSNTPDDNLTNNTKKATNVLSVYVCPSTLCGAWNSIISTFFPRKLNYCYTLCKKNVFTKYLRRGVQRSLNASCGGIEKKNTICDKGKMKCI